MTGTYLREYIRRKDKQLQQELSIIKEEEKKIKQSHQRKIDLVQRLGKNFCSLMDRSDHTNRMAILNPLNRMHYSSVFYNNKSVDPELPQAPILQGLVNFRKYFRNHKSMSKKEKQTLEIRFDGMWHEVIGLIEDRKITKEFYDFIVESSSRKIYKSVEGNEWMWRREFSREGTSYQEEVVNKGRNPRDAFHKVYEN